MRKSWIWIGLLAVLAGVGALLLLRAQRCEWTSASREAEAEFERGMEARMRLYPEQAREHFAKAIELAPDFIAAQVVLADLSDKEARDTIFAELEELDLDTLTDRERFLVEHRLAQAAQEQDRARAVLEDYLEQAPKDPFALAARAVAAWTSQDWEVAEKYYKRLIKVDPNWVLAQNHLGYIAMAQGRFAEAEEAFKKYRFIAPDQANPHDSMGELLTLTGRYEEAVAELEESLAIREDFCASYYHLVDVMVLDGRPHEAYPILERSEAHCSGEHPLDQSRCELAFWADYLKGDFDAPWSEERAECLEASGPISFLIHRMAALSGRWEEAEKVEAALAAHVEKTAQGAPEIESKNAYGFLQHLQGVRLLAQGDVEGAIEKLETADEALYYWGQNQGILKLFNRLNLAFAYDRGGREADAAAVVEKVREVNAPFADQFEHMGESFASVAAAAGTSG